MKNKTTKKLILAILMLLLLTIVIIPESIAGINPRTNNRKSAKWGTSRCKLCRPNSKLTENTWSIYCSRRANDNWYKVYDRKSRRKSGL